MKLEDPGKLGGRDFTIRLRDRRLEGANLSRAKLGKADLREAKLQGARLTGGWLQGATLLRAQLQGAFLARAQLQGATLDVANLKGAFLVSAEMQGADLSDALVWRAYFSHATLTDMRAERLNWKPVARTDIGELESWTQEVYVSLRDTRTKAIPEGERRTEALLRIEHLNCRKIPGKSHCVEDAAHPQIKSLPDEAYAAGLAELLRALVCNADENAIHVLRRYTHRGPARYSRLYATGANAPKLIADILKPASESDCPVSADLTAEDKAQLLEIKKVAEKDFKQLPAPAKPEKAQ